MLLSIIIISVPVTILITIILLPLWSWFESAAGFESLGHSGPAGWCYLFIFILIYAIGIIVFSIRKKHFNKKSNDASDSL